MAERHLQPVSSPSDLSAEDEYSLYVRSVMGDDEAKQEVMSLPDDVRDPLVADIRASGGSFD